MILGLRNLNPSRLPFYQPFFRPLYKLLLNDARVSLVANSRVGAVDYAQWLGIDPDRIAIVYNGFAASGYGVDTAATTTARPSPCAPLVLGVSQFRPEKDPLLFVAACSEIARDLPAARFMLIGDGPLQREARQKALELGILDRIEFTGRRADILTYMRRADIFLHTAYVEGLPNVLLEAQSVGLPIVAAAAGGVAEAIEVDVTGIVVEERTGRALADEVVRRLADRVWYDRARQAGPPYIRDRFSVTRMIEGTLAVYKLSRISAAEVNTHD